jgi:transmembrane sensor
MHQHSLPIFKKSAIEQNIVEKAIDWHLHLHSDEATPADNIAFEAWCHESPEHELAYNRLENMWGKFGDLDHAAAKAGLEAALKSGSAIKTITRHSRRVALGLLILVSTYSVMQSQPGLVWLAENKTPIGEQRNITLDDGSILMLNTNTALDVEYSDHQRLLKLHQGEVFITVAKDKSRPLIIATQHGTARALGTKFNVRLIEDSTQVAVVESTVETCNTPSLLSMPLLNSSKKTCTTVQAGQGARYTSGQMEIVSNIDTETIAGWSTGTLAIDNQPLPMVLTELQRYSVAQINFNESTLANMRVSGVLPLNNIRQSLDILSGKLPIKVSEPQANVITVGLR